MPTLITAITLLLCVVGAAAQDVSVLVAYHSQTGNTEKMAEAIAEGAAGEGVTVVMKKVTELGRTDLEAADAVILGSPVHMGDVAVEVRQTLVDWSYKFGFWRSHGLENKVCAVFATGAAASNGKEFTMMSMALGMTQFGMVLVTPYGGIGASATTGFPEYEKGVGDHELEEARKLGARVVVVARRMKE